MVKFSRIIECRTCSGSDPLFQHKLRIVGRWVIGKCLVRRWSVGQWSMGVIPATHLWPAIISYSILRERKIFCSIFFNAVFRLLHIVRFTIWNQLFLLFWLVNTWFFAHPLDQRAVTHFENVSQLNITPGKKLVLELSHRQLP